MENFWYSIIKQYFDAGLYATDCTHDRYVGKFCEYKNLTPEQYKEITKEEYQP